MPPTRVASWGTLAAAASKNFSGAQARWCIENSLTLLGLSRLQLVYLHDPEYTLTFAQAMAPDEFGSMAVLNVSFTFVLF